MQLYRRKLIKDQIDSFYKQLGDCFKQRYSGYDVWLISNNADALKSFGLRPTKVLTLFNGALENKYQKYDMYRGTQKPKLTKPKA